MDEYKKEKKINSNNYNYLEDQSIAIADKFQHFKENFEDSNSNEQVTKSQESSQPTISNKSQASSQRTISDKPQASSDGKNKRGSPKGVNDLDLNNKNISLIKSSDLIEPSKTYGNGIDIPTISKEMEDVL